VRIGANPARAVAILLSATLALLAGGCATAPPDPRPLYVRPKLPDSQVAKIKGTSGFGGGHYVDEVDGARVKVNFAWSVTVLPGEHTIKISTGRSTYNGPGLGGESATRTVSFTYNFEAGHQYKLVTKGTGWQLVLKDETAGKPIPIE